MIFSIIGYLTLAVLVVFGGYSLVTLLIDFDLLGLLRQGLTRSADRPVPVEPEPAEQAVAEEAQPREYAEAGRSS